jgi:hypothetical protein
LTLQSRQKRWDLTLPAGFKVTTNDRVFNDEGAQIAEFDVHARGRIGTTEFDWFQLP